MVPKTEAPRSRAPERTADSREVSDSEVATSTSTSTVAESPAPPPELFLPPVPETLGKIELQPLIPSINEKRWAKLQSGTQGREMVGLFLELAPGKCEKLEEAVLRDDFAVIEELAHFLKSSASAMAFDRWTDQLGRLEEAGAAQDSESCHSLWSEVDAEYRNLLEWLAPQLKTG